jgi:enoyl-[acyl-carrier-protein] reductase (NADH)
MSFLLASAVTGETIYVDAGYHITDVSYEGETT